MSEQNKKNTAFVSNKRTDMSLFCMSWIRFFFLTSASSAELKWGISHTLQEWDRSAIVISVL